MAPFKADWWFNLHQSMSFS